MNNLILFLAIFFLLISKGGYAQTGINNRVDLIFIHCLLKTNSFDYNACIHDAADECKTGTETEDIADQCNNIAILINKGMNLPDPVAFSPSGSDTTGGFGGIHDTNTHTDGLDDVLNEQELLNNELLKQLNNNDVNIQSR